MRLLPVFCILLFISLSFLSCRPYFPTAEQSGHNLATRFSGNTSKIGATVFPDAISKNMTIASDTSFIPPSVLPEIHIKKRSVKFPVILVSIPKGDTVTDRKWNGDPADAQKQVEEDIRNGWISYAFGFIFFIPFLIALVFFIKANREMKKYNITDEKLRKSAKTGIWLSIVSMLAEVILTILLISLLVQSTVLLNLH